MTKLSMLKTGAMAFIAFSFVSTTSFASLQNNTVGANKFANTPTNQFKSKEYHQEHSFLLYKLILDAGARANGTKRESAGSAEKHATWCARWNNTYDPSSNTIAGLGNTRLPCISPYGN